MPHFRPHSLLSLLAGLILLTACGETVTAPPTVVPSLPAATTTLPPLATTTLPPPASATPPPAPTASLPPPATATPPPPATAPPLAPNPAGAAGGWTVTATDTLELPPGAAYLAPDGTQIAWVHGKQICLYPAQGGQATCAQIASGVDPNSVRWAPDSTRLAFTENYQVEFVDPDIWVLDAASGKATDLTDDGVAGAVPLSKAPSGPIDVAPAWSADSRQLVFLRATERNEAVPMSLYTIPAGGGSPHQVGTLTAGVWQIYALAWTRDGQEIAYNFDDLRPENPKNGAWLAGLSGADAKQLLGKPGASEVQLSPDGRYLLAFSRWPLIQPGPAVSTSRLVALAGGAEVPIAPGPADWAAWAPAGSALAYLQRAAAGGSAPGVYVAPAPGTAGQLVLAGQYAPLTGQDGWRALSWAANNTILLQRVSDGKPVLVHLSGGR